MTYRGSGNSSNVTYGICGISDVPRDVGDLLDVVDDVAGDSWANTCEADSSAVTNVRSMNCMFVVVFGGVRRLYLVSESWWFSCWW